MPYRNTYSSCYPNVILICTKLHLKKYRFRITLNDKSSITFKTWLETKKDDDNGYEDYDITFSNRIRNNDIVKNIKLINTTTLRFSLYRNWDYDYDNFSADEFSSDDELHNKHVNISNPDHLKVGWKNFDIDAKISNTNLRYNIDVCGNKFWPHIHVKKTRDSLIYITYSTNGVSLVSHLEATSSYVKITLESGHKIEYCILDEFVVGGGKHEIKHSIKVGDIIKNIEYVDNDEDGGAKLNLSIRHEDETTDQISTIYHCIS